ncbi:hypothetical protein HanRHA438_Chr04g0182201 [Helianthus annuus]|uniref:Uncharacterized protein n=1 Tax=Helianthus annuus TaxID=4232 RepID=A0A9K3J8Y1_HELAN|nr:hypothetical protein HanXRQr2_Chr04g0172531 [Helianthus annuus]KAJ0927380.1 hypothetical protein HanRHA438_Chr04g0182201 [Helianthus annuus]KAJ0931808.1 hypothetical protein HanPSC8_Chr04g0166221 [Helianthus annuus]
MYETFLDGKYALRIHQEGLSGCEASEYHQLSRLLTHLLSQLQDYCPQDKKVTN